MTVSSDSAADKILELLATLKTTVEEFAARSEKLNEEFRVKLTREHQRCEVAVQEQNQQLAATLAQADAAIEAARAAALARYEKRKTRIGKAYQGSKEQALKRVENHVGGRKYDLQKRTLQAERDRDAALAAATAAFQEFRQNLAAQQETLAQREGAAQRLFKGYRRFHRYFFRAYENAVADLSRDEHQLL